MESAVKTQEEERHVESEGCEERMEEKEEKVGWYWLDETQELRLSEEVRWMKWWVVLRVFLLIVIVGHL